MASEQHEVIRPFRVLYFVPLVAASGYLALLLLPFGGSAERFFAWTPRSGLTAATLGACYAAALVLFCSALRLRRWVEVRTAVLMSLVQLTVMLAVVLGHRERLHLDGGSLGGVVGAYAFLAAHLTAPAAGLALLAAQLRGQRGTARPERPEPVPWWTAVPIGSVAVVGTTLGLFMLLAPGATGDIWPWPVDALDLRALGSWTLVFGLGSAWVLVEREPARMRAGALAYLTAGLAALLALLLHTGAMNWTVWPAWFYLLGLGGLVVLGLGGLVLSTGVRRWQDAYGGEPA